VTSVRHPCVGVTWNKIVPKYGRPGGSRLRTESGAGGDRSNFRTSAGSVRSSRNILAVNHAVPVSGRPNRHSKREVLVMKSATQSLLQVPPKVERAQSELGFFSSESVLDILRLILAGSELSEVLTIIARSIEAQGNGTLCTIWLPDADGKHLHCAAAPSLPGFAENVGRMSVCSKGASCGTAVYRREPVYVADIFRESIWDDYRDLVLPYGIRAVWSRPLFTRDDSVLGTFAHPLS